MQGIAAYQDNAVTTQSGGRIIVLLYDGAIKFLRQMISAIERKDYAAKALYFNRAMDILDELNFSLDMEQGGEVAANLRKLYVFMRTHVTMASNKMDVEAIREVISLLEELNEGWKAIT